MKRAVSGILKSAIAVFGLVVAGSGFAQTVYETQKLLAADGATYDSFGYAVAIDGNTALVGAYAHDDVGFRSGAVYVYSRTAGVWSLQQKLVADDAEEFDEFGGSVSLSGNTAVIGARREDHSGDSSGSAYVFIRTPSGWTQQQKLLAPDGERWDNFGWSVAIDADTAIVGAVSDDDIAYGSGAGSAYVFTRSYIWSFQQKLVAPDAAQMDMFGWSVAIDGNTAVVSAYGDDDEGESSGSLYVYTRSAGTWSFQQKLIPGDGTEWHLFGASVAIDGDTLLVGAFGDHHNTPNTHIGSAYVYTRTAGNWSLQEKLSALDGAPADSFGQSVALDGDIAVIGATADDTVGAADSGSAYVFLRTAGNWTQLNQLLASDAESVDYFGYHSHGVAVSGDTALVGAPGNDDSGDWSGSAYIFEGIDSLRPPPPIICVLVCEPFGQFGCDNVVLRCYFISIIIVIIPVVIILWYWTYRRRQRT